ncbi:MAG TPA: tRNA (adenosine(37)-N6)-threonylcarbamoyltransferase complex ATPase subunit type 1 TsaE [Vicinamibacterales bacterium]
MASPEAFTTHSEQDTFALGKTIAATLRPGTFVLLHGDLGAGKTAFVRGVAAGLGANADDVSSPTFVLIQHYKGRTPLVHVDLYRLDTGAAIDDLGLEELVVGAVVAIEWAERLPRPLEESVTVRIADLGNDSRHITIEKGSGSLFR